MLAPISAELQTVGGGRQIARFTKDTPFDPRKTPQCLSMTNVYEVEKGLWEGTVHTMVDFVQSIPPSVKKILFWIHGYNNHPADVFLTYNNLISHLQHEDPTFLIIPIFWACSNSWMDSYVEDQGISWATGLCLGQIFTQYFTLTGGLQHEVSIAAHSMGNRVLQFAILSFSPLPQHSIFSRIFSIAADIPNTLFERGHSGDRWAALAKAVVIFFSPKDKKLSLSQFVNTFRSVSHGARLGLSGPIDYDNLPPNVQAVDCSDFNQTSDWPMGHSYQTSPELLSYLDQSLSGIQERLIIVQKWNPLWTKHCSFDIRIPKLYLDLPRLEPSLPGLITLSDVQRERLVARGFGDRNYKYRVATDMYLTFKMDWNGRTETCRVIILQGFLTDGNSATQSDLDDLVCQKEWLIHDWLYFSKQFWRIKEPEKLIKLNSSPQHRKAVDSVFKHSTSDPEIGECIYAGLQVAETVGIPQSIWVQWCQRNTTSLVDLPFDPPRFRSEDTASIPWNLWFSQAISTSPLIINPASTSNLA
jgi:esterase/lipase superfamily enzyme